MHRSRRSALATIIVVSALGSAAPANATRGSNDWLVPSAHQINLHY